MPQPRARARRGQGGGYLDGTGRRLAMKVGCQPLPVGSCLASRLPMRVRAGTRGWGGVRAGLGIRIRTGALGCACGME